ncbi:MAG: DJ-1/PfpI family protein [Candidatus Omnitrophica bacterium]|nr:DJ-1/PfpI family protein [Candidatus Omnitrophota bacterium]MBU1924531.1 DJ-1/PfpI family protein [Candidatus Omnitrophota bacterium]
MAKKVLVVLAEGFEEIEAVAVIDLLRRAELEVIIASIEKRVLVRGSRRIALEANIPLKDFSDIPDALVLPGGIPGVENLAKSDMVCDLVRKCNQEGKIIAAICAAPAYVLTRCGILEGRKVTCYPGDENRFLSSTTYVNEDVVTDANLITSRGVGTAFNFALALIENLLGPEAAAKVKERTLIK